MAAKCFVVLAILAAIVASSTATKVIHEKWAAPPAAWTRGQRAAASELIHLTIAVRQTNLLELEDAVMSVSDPDSPKYGQHLSRDEVDALVAPKPEHIMAVLAWLYEADIPESAITATGNSDFIMVDTTVGVAEELLGAPYFTYTHVDRPSISLARIAGAYSLPATVSEAVDFVGPTIRFPRLNRMTVRPATPDSFGVTPSFLRTLYKVGDATGSASNNKQAVAQFLGQYYAPSDLANFFSQFSKSEMGKTPTVVGPNDASSPGDEASLDIEYIMSVATNIATEFWSTSGQQPHNPGNEPFLTWLTNVAKTSDADVPKTFSVSYGDDEPSVNFEYAVRVNAEFQKAGARGISLMFASGDGGVSGSQPSLCTTFVPTFPAGSPWVTAVGGTASYNPEVTASLSSGGFSNYWARPSYQDTHVQHYFSVAQNLPSSSVYNHTGAGFPDVAAQAESFNIVLDGFTTLVDGTSCASPTFASIVSLLNDARLSAGKSSMGYLNPMFYKNPSMFTDITSGNNPGCNSNGFQAAAGWDPDTGLGTANYMAMKDVIMNL